VTFPSASASTSASKEREAHPSVVLGVVVAPGLAQDVTAKVAADLEDDLLQSHGAVHWRTELIVDRLVEPPVPTTEIFAAARRRLLEGDWDLGVVVTDLPLRLGGRPVLRHVSPTHGIAIVSLPALGAIHLRRRLRRTLVELVGELVGDSDESRNGDGPLVRLRRSWQQNVLRELATETAHRPGGLQLLFVPAVVLSHVRLLSGMVRANRPWRFAARLYAALVAALAVGAYAIIAADIWRLSAAMESWRLAILSLVSISATIAAVIAAHGLWERSRDPRVREQVVLFNIATTSTVAIGILTLYLALFVLSLAGAALLITPRVLSDSIGRSAGFGDYAALAWFAASFGTIGGALGAGLESREAVREAAYASSPSESEDRATEAADSRT
jgi:hypothetical protein